VVGVLLAVGVFAQQVLLPPARNALAGASASVTLSGAASRLEESTRSGASGFSFTVVSRSTLFAKPGGPRIEIPDPDDRYKTLGLADEYYTGAAIAEGIARSDGFWLQMRAGPVKDAAPDFANAQITMASLTRGTTTWRNNGDGWFVTDQPPGIGIDVQTLAKLPSLLRNATSAKLDGTGTIDGINVTKLSAGGTIDNAPGLMGIDAASFSELAAPIDYAIDGSGRLVQLHARVRNLRVETFDLITDVTVTLRYDPAPGSLPEPVPTAPPIDDLPRPGSVQQ
jgi:hypothetical protein